MKSHDDGLASERLGAILREAHHRVEAAESGRISQAQMATRLSVSQRAYVDYLHGRGPAGVRVAFDILAMLGDDEAVSLLRRWREGNIGNGKERNGD
jgi:hypothetical protein